MNIRKELDVGLGSIALEGEQTLSATPRRDLVDLGEAKAETHGSAGGALDLPITSGHD